MFIRDLNGKEYFLQGVIKHDQELNGDERIDIDIEYTDINSEFLSKQDDLKMWIILFEGKEYRIISSKQTGFGDKYRISVTAVLYMLDWLNSHRVYERIDASLTVTEAFNIVFNDTPFTYSTVESAPSNRFEGIGEGETRLEIFKTFIDRYGYEFKIVGNVVYLYNQIGNDANFEYRYKVNAQNIEKEVDASEMWTYARGYGNYSDDDSDTDVVEKAKLKREYTSPLAKIIGIREAPPIRDGRVTKQATMDANLKKTVDESVKVSFTADIYDMSQQGYDYQHAVLGDRVFLVDERIGLDTEIRVVKITRNFSSTGQILDLEITFGSSNMADQYGSNLSTAAKDIADLIQGRKSLPFQALDIISKSMVTKIQNTSSEIIYDTNGQHFMDKKNNNNIMTMNSSGLLLSTDGGKTAKTAITAEGIVADTITTGTLNANLISVRGGDNSKFVEIKNDEMTLFGTFKRTWQNNTTTNNVFTRFKNGHLRFRNNDLNRSIYFSDFGISTYLDGDSSDASGTLEFFDYTYSGARGVTLNSGLGVVALRTDSNRILLDSHATVNIESKTSSLYFRPMSDNRVGRNEFRMWVKENSGASDTDGILSYGSITSGSTYGSSLRFDKSSSTNYVYATNNNGDIGSGDFYARDLYGMLKAKADNQYIGVNGALRITDMKGYNGGNVNYKDLQVKDIQAGSIRTHDGNFYIGVSTNELRVTNNLLYNGGDIGYKPVRASDFNNASLEEYKENINEWNFDALSAINNETQLYSFNYKSDEKKETKYGLVIGEGYKTPSELTSGDGVNIYGMATWSFRAIQQLTKRVEELENGTK